MNKVVETVFFFFMFDKLTVLPGILPMGMKFFSVSQ